MRKPLNKVLEVDAVRRNRFLYILLSIGVIGAFVGHGMWAVGGKDSFVKLFTGSFDRVLGVSLTAETGTAWVKGIGWFDLAVGVVVALMLVGVALGRGRLYQLAYSRLALVVFGWGVLWGFATAASRVTSAGQFYPEVWDVVERAPNFMLPATLVYLVYQHRLDHTAVKAAAEMIQQGVRLTR